MSFGHFLGLVEAQRWIYPTKLLTVRPHFSPLGLMASLNSLIKYLSLVTNTMTQRLPLFMGPSIVSRSLAADIKTLISIGSGVVVKLSASSRGHCARLRLKW